MTTTKTTNIPPTDEEQEFDEDREFVESAKIVLNSKQMQEKLENFLRNYDPSREYINVKKA